MLARLELSLSTCTGLARWWVVGWGIALRWRTLHTRLGLRGHGGSFLNYRPGTLLGIVPTLFHEKSQYTQTTHNAQHDGPDSQHNAPGEFPIGRDMTTCTFKGRLSCIQKILYQCVPGMLHIQGILFLIVRL